MQCGRVALLALGLLLGITGSSARTRCEPCDLVVRQGANGGLVAVHNPPTSQLSSPAANIIWARYWDTYDDTGWDRIEILSLAAVPVPDTVKARAAGYAEGHIHANRIFNYWHNYRLNEFHTSDHRPTKDLLDWIDAQDHFVRSHIQKFTSGGMGTHASGTGEQNEAEEQQYWRLMGLVMAHFDGLCEGIWDSASPDRNLTYHELYLLQSAGDLYDLKVLFPQRDAPGPRLGYDIDDYGIPLVSGASGAGRKAEPGAQLGTEGGARQMGQRRDFQPGHGVVGAGGYGSGEMLECSALIKLQSSTAEAAGGAAGLGASDAAGRKLRGRGLKHGGGAHVRRAATGLAVLSGQGDARVKISAGKAVQEKGDEAVEAVGRPYSDFWAAHTTWRPYYAMLRTWKVYQFPWSKSGPITVSSSPGFVAYSKDDWYTTDRFVIMETTNGIYNKSLYDAIQPHCALTWQRVQVANLGASSGAEWVSLFGRHNSGTYNNQWMVLDVDKLMKGHQSDVLWVLEQIPGKTEVADVTPVLLQQGYWASYNVPFFASIYNASGYPADDNIYHTCPRAQLFAREQESIRSTQDMQTVIRLNRYGTDPLSQGNPADAISSRYDLVPNPGAVANWTRRAFGAVDAKLVDWWSFRQQITYVINGPTADDQEPFSWGGFCSDLEREAVKFGSGQRPARLRQPAVCDSHEGLPDTFNFVWEGLQASLPWMNRQRP